MEPDSTLIGVAEIAVALAGFSGIAAAVRHGTAPTWPRVDRDRMVDLVTHSGIALFASLLPLIFGHRGGIDAELWAISSCAWAVCAAIGIGLGLNRSRRRGTLGSTPNRVIPFLFLLVLILQIYNAGVLQAFWPYLTALCANLAFAFVQFMALAMPHATPD